MTNEYSICAFPFDTAQINLQGDIFVCCPPWCNFFSLGNIHEKTFDEIWNGDKAKEFRRQFITKNYNICNTNLCTKDCSRNIIPTEIAPKPKKFIFSYDSNCNVKCIFCRDCNHNLDLSYFDENMDKLINSFLENAEDIVISGAGEALASSHSRRFIKRVAELYPNIKFSLISNGILCDENNLTELGIIDKLNFITISLHASKKETYDKLVINGNFDRVMSNLKFLSKLKKEGKLDRFILNFVINSYNYKEMVSYIEMAKELGATVGFLELLKYETNKKIFDKLNILDEKHPKYNDLAKILKNPIFKSEICTVNDNMLNIKPISLLKKLKYKFLNN